MILEQNYLFTWNLNPKTDAIALFKARMNIA